MRRAHWAASIASGRRAQRIDQRHLPIPPAQAHDRGGQRFLERRLACVLPITACVQRGAAQIQRHLGAIAHPVHDDAHVRIAFVDVGSRAVAFAQAIDDRVLDALRDETRVRDRGVAHERVDGQLRRASSTRSQLTAFTPSYTSSALSARKLA